MVEKENMFPIVDIAHEKILGVGHTLCVVEWYDKLFGYKGEVDFSRITLLKNFKPCKVVLKNRRWAVAKVVGSNIHLFCTSRKEGTRGWNYQYIHHYVSVDGENFREVDIITNGSAPWVFEENGRFYFYYHVNIDGLHNIYVKEVEDLFSLKEAVPKCILSSMNVYSAPSVLRMNSIYYITLEYREKERSPWRTIIGKLQTPTSKIVSWKFFLDDWKACCFLHSKFITYSNKNRSFWDLRWVELK